MSVLATFPLSSALQGPFSPLHFYLLALCAWFCVAIILGRGERRETEPDLWLKRTWMEGWDNWHLDFYPAYDLSVLTASGLHSLALLGSMRDVGVIAGNGHWRLGTQGCYVTSKLRTFVPLYLWKAQANTSLLFSFPFFLSSSFFLHSFLPSFLLLSLFLSFCKNFSLFSGVTSILSNCLKGEKDCKQDGKSHWWEDFVHETRHSHLLMSLSLFRSRNPRWQTCRDPSFLEI